MPTYSEPMPIPLAQLPPAFRDEIAKYEVELSALHPAWQSTVRAECRFDHFDYERKARVKWLLKRRSLLLRGLDWTVIIAPDGKDRTKCYAHAIMPTAPRREVTTDPPSPLAMTIAPSWSPPAGSAVVSLPTLAALLRIPLEVVEAAMGDAPAGVDPREWCAAYHKAHRRRHRAASRAVEASP